VLHAEELADPILRGLNRAIDLGGRQPREVRKQLSDQASNARLCRNAEARASSATAPRSAGADLSTCSLANVERSSLPGSGFV
jgi:hypothetical protein